MIQAPVSNYGMSPVAMQPQPQAQPQCRAIAPSYNAVQINLDTPTLNAPPAMPYYMPPNMVQPQTQPQYQPQMPAQQPQQAPVQQPTGNNVPAPVLPQNDVNVQQPMAEAPETIADKAFKGLSSDNFDEQAAVMEEIAKKGIPEEGKTVNTEDLVPYVQANIVDRLTEIMNFDSSKLDGPTEQQMELRKKLVANEQAKAEAQAKGQEAKLPFEMSEQEVALAKQLSPFEQAERNKEYALFTTAILQKTYADSIKAAGDPVPPITELPGSRAVITQLKSNPSADMAISAMDAIKFVADGKPEYKNDVATLFTIAQNDSRQEVADAATRNLAELNK